MKSSVDRTLHRLDLPPLLLVMAGASLMVMSAYFLVLRPPLLPEDLRFLGIAPAVLDQVAPGLNRWLPWVFRVLGGYIGATGLLTVHLALTSFRSGARGSLAVAAAAGVASIGCMTVVNFVIGSDFRWLLAAIAGLWGLALALRAIGGGAWGRRAWRTK